MFCGVFVDVFRCEVVSVRAAAAGRDARRVVGLAGLVPWVGGRADVAFNAEDAEFGHEDAEELVAG